MSTTFNEATRVQMPALVHLSRLGYSYFGKITEEGIKSGVVWHTQGSGKTALAYYLNYLLTYFFAKFNKVAKFYFIVDRLDLLKQATQEFEARGLTVKTANSRKELLEQFRTLHALEGNNGQREVTVINSTFPLQNHYVIKI